MFRRGSAWPVRFGRVVGPVVAAIALASACTHVEARRISVEQHETLVYRYERLLLPVPDAVTGFTLTLSLDRALVVSGARFGSGATRNGALASAVPAP
jgi:hypothetical protein